MLDGNAETEILPQLICKGLGSLEKEWLPIMAGVERSLGLANCFASRSSSGSLDKLYLGAIGPCLCDLARRGGAWCQDLDANAAGRPVSRDGRATVPGTVLKDRLGLLH